MTDFFKRLVMVPWEDKVAMEKELTAPNANLDCNVLMMVIGIWIQQAIDSVEEAPSELFIQLGILDFAARNDTWVEGQPTTNDMCNYIEEKRAAKNA